MDLLEARDADELAQAVGDVAAAAVGRLEALEDGWRAGAWDAVRQASIVTTEFVEALVPDRIAPGEAQDGELLRTAVLDRWVGVSCSGWVDRFGLALGSLTALAAAARELSSAAEPVAPPSATGAAVLAADHRLLWRLQLAALEDDEPPLAVLARRLGLNDTGLAELFGVSRQAVTKWRAVGIPHSRAAQAAHLLAAVSLLDRQLRQGRLPLMARRPAPAFGGRTLLEVLRDDPAGAREAVEAAFDFAATA